MSQIFSLYPDISSHDFESFGLKIDFLGNVTLNLVTKTGNNHKPPQTTTNHQQMTTNDHKQPQTTTQNKPPINDYKIPTNEH